MPEKTCLDCGVSYEVLPTEVAWRNYCVACYTIRMTLKEQGLSKEEIEKIRQLGKAGVEVIQPSKENIMTQSRKELMKTEYEGFVGDTPLVEVLKEIKELLSRMVFIFDNRMKKVGDHSV